MLGKGRFYTADDPGEKTGSGMVEALWKKLTNSSPRAKSSLPLIFAKKGFCLVHAHWFMFVLSATLAVLNYNGRIE